VAITPKSVTVGTNNGSTATVSVTTSESPSATQVGDLVVVFHSNDFYAISNMITPTATGSPTMNAITGATVDAGTSSSHVKAYWYIANTGGAQTISSTHTGSHDEDKTLVAWVLPAAQVNTSTPVDAAGAQGTNGSSSTSAQVLTGATAAAAGALLLAHLHSAGSAGTASYTTGSMTEAGEWHVFTSGVYASEQLVSSGATGSRTITAASSTPYVGALVVIEPAAGGGGAPAWVPVAAARRRIPVRPRRALEVAPVRAQVNPPFPTAEFHQPRRLRALLPRRARIAAPVPAQIVVTPPAYPPQPERIRLKVARLFRPRVSAPVPAQATPPPLVFVPQPDPRPRLRLRPVRGHAVTPPAAQASPPLLERIRLRVVRAFRGKVRQPVPPQIVVIPPEKAAQALRSRHAQFAARRRRGGVEGWMVGGSHLCTITRPSTGITGHTVLLTPRPSAGVTGHTATLTARPDTGITEDPC
jgi:hypothetical protein